MKKRLLYWFLTLGFASLSQAADLVDIYRHALENDPVFKAAYSKFMANSEVLPQALSALLPQVDVGAQAGRYVQHVVVNGDLIPGVSSSDTSFILEQTYNSNQWRVQASQAIFNYHSWAKVQQAKASVKAAHATFNNAAQDLILRTAKAYFDVLLARDTLNYAEAKKRANKRQLEQAQQRFDVGLDPITSVYEAKAAFDRSTASVIAARNNQVNKNEKLRKLTNHVYEQLAPLRDSTIPLIKPEPNNADDWIATGIKQNYKLFAATYSLQAARENIKAKAASGWPTLAVHGNSIQTHNNVSGSNFFVPSSQLIANISIAVNLPLYKGGLIESETRQAQFIFQAASERLEQIYREVLVNSEIAFNTIIDGISMVKANRQTIISQQNSLESTEAQFQTGTRTMVDVVNAQQKLFEAQEQLASSQYRLINSILRLKYMAGSLNVTDLEEINAWLATTRIGSFPNNPPQSKPSIPSAHP